MNETLKTIFERYSCRDFADTPLTDEQIKTIVEAALAAPSARNNMPWQVIVVTDKNLIEEIDAEGIRAIKAANDDYSLSRIQEDGGKIFYNAPCLVVIASDGSFFSPVDCGILCQNITLAAHSLGLGSVICGFARFPMAGPRADEFKKRLGFPEGYDFCISVLVGTPKTGKAPHDFDMSKVTYIKA